MIAGIVLFALGLEKTVAHVGERLDTGARGRALRRGCALESAGRAAQERDVPDEVFRRRTIGAVALLALVPVALVTPALVALAFVSVVCAAVVAYEAIHYREHRLQVRHPT